MLTTIELTEDEAKLFLEFQKRFAFVQLLDSIKAFQMKSGSITIHFDSFGQIASVDKQEHYRV